MSPRTGVTVRFGLREATAVVVQSDSSIKVATPAGDKGATTDVTLILDDGRSFVLRNSFRYVDATERRQPASMSAATAGSRKKDSAAASAAALRRR